MVSSLRMTAVSASFLGLPIDEAFVEALENRVVPGGDEGGHVEAGADLGAAAPDGAPAAHGTAVPVEGGDADQGGDLPSVEAAEFGQVGDQGAGGGLADAGHALEQVLGLAPGRAAPDGGVDLGLEIGQFALERLEQPVDALEGAPAGQAGAAVALGGHHLDDLAPAGDQLCERAGLFVGHRPGRRRDRFGEMGDRRGVQRVGLGKLAGRPGEVADLARVDHRQRQARRTQRRRHRDLVADQRPAASRPTGDTHQSQTLRPGDAAPSSLKPVPLHQAMLRQFLGTLVPANRLQSLATRFLHSAARRAAPVGMTGEGTRLTALRSICRTRGAAFQAAPADTTESNPASRRCCASS